MTQAVVVAWPNAARLVPSSDGERHGAGRPVFTVDFHRRKPMQVVLRLSDQATNLGAVERWLTQRKHSAVVASPRVSERHRLQVLAASFAMSPSEYAVSSK